MQGVDFIADGNGRRKAVVIDLAEHGDLLEDIFDVVIAGRRRKETSIDLESLKQRSDKRDINP